MEAQDKVGWRVLRSRIGGYALAAKRDPVEYTKAARQAFMTRFEREVDPDGVLARDERSRRAEAAKKAYFTGLALKSSRQRLKKASAARA